MSEFIRKQAVLNLLEDFEFNLDAGAWEITHDGVIKLKDDTLKKLHKAVKAMPAEKVEPVVYAAWLDEVDGRCKCSECETDFPLFVAKYWYCPACGAYMDDEEMEEE